MVTAGSKLTHAGHAGLQNSWCVVGKATMYLFDLSAGPDQFLWTIMFCPLNLVNVEPHEVKSLPVAANRCENKSRHSKKKKNRAVVGLGASQSVTDGGHPTAN